MSGKWLYRAKSDSVHVPHADYPYGEQLFQFRYSEFDGDSGVPSDENLALILAAPELFEALVDMVEAYEHEASAENPALLKARAAILRAAKSPD